MTTLSTSIITFRVGNSTLRVRRKVLWGLSCAYLALIYATLPFMRPFLVHVNAFIGREALSIVINAIVALVALASAVLAIRRVEGNAAFKSLPFVALAAFVSLIDIPEERVHFIEYGLLGLLVSGAAGTGRRSTLIAFCLVAAAGAVDEFIQLLLPNRVGDMRDVFMNAVGGSLGIWAERLINIRDACSPEQESGKDHT